MATCNDQREEVNLKTQNQENFGWERPAQMLAICILLFVFMMKYTFFPFLSQSRRNHEQVCSLLFLIG